MAELLLELTRRYTEPHRHYHGLPHIAAMLAAGRTFPLDAVQILRRGSTTPSRDASSRINEADRAALGRRALFQAMLQRERLFFTPWGAALEPLARRNLQRAVAG